MGLVFGLTSVILMASGPVINKMILKTTSSEFSALANVCISTVFFSLIQLLSGKSIKLRMNRSTIFSGLFSALGLVSMFFALKIVHPAVFGFVGRLGVVFAMIFSSIFLRQTPDAPEIALGAIALLGALGSAFHDISNQSFLGFSLAFGSTLFFALSNLSLKFASKHGTNSQVLASSNLVSFILLLLVFSLASQHAKIPSDLKSWELIFAGSLLGSCLGFWCYLESLKFLSLSKASILRATGPVFTAVISYPFFGFNLSGVQLISAIILLLSVISLTFYERNKNKIHTLAATD